MAETRRDESGDRTQVPTQLRLAEARRQGRVARSGELTAAAAVVGCMTILAVLGPGLLKEMTRMTAAFLDAGSDDPAYSGEVVRELLVRGAGPSVTMVVALLLASSAVVALVGGVQVGGGVWPGQVRPDFQRINPWAGAGKLWSSRTAVRAALTVVRVAVVAVVTVESVRSAMPRLLAAGGMNAWQLAGEAGNLVGGVALRIGLCLLALGGADWLYQRWQHKRDLRMTRAEWVRDLRTMEGDGHVRRRRHELAGQLSDVRALRDVGSAHVVVFDPHGGAAALRYDASAEAPIVVAKGTGLGALRLRRTAEASGVAVVAEPTVARKICRQCRSGETIAEGLYDAVARILAGHGPRDARRRESSHG